MAIKVYLKDNNIVIETDLTRKLIPSNRFSIDPSNEIMGVFDNNVKSVSFNAHYSNYLGQSKNGSEITFQNIIELEDYLSPLVNILK